VKNKFDLAKRVPEYISHGGDYPVADMSCLVHVIIADLACEVGILVLLHSLLGLIGAILAIEVLIVGLTFRMLVTERTLQILHDGHARTHLLYLYLFYFRNYLYSQAGQK